MEADQQRPSDIAATKQYHRRLEEDRLEDVPLCRVPAGWYAALSVPISEGPFFYLRRETGERGKGMSADANTRRPSTIGDMTAADWYRGYVDANGQWHDWPASVERPHHGHQGRDGTYTDLGEV